MKFTKKANKKGQAAMEFLMTYGWAILVVLAAVAALAYFGVLSPSSFMPEKCTMPSGVACLDFKSTGSGFSFVMQNSAGFDMTNVTVGVLGTDCTANATSGAGTLTNGEKSTYDVSCSPAAGKFKGKVGFWYTNKRTGMSHVKEGDLIVEVQ